VRQPARSQLIPALFLALACTTPLSRSDSAPAVRPSASETPTKVSADAASIDSALPEEPEAQAFERNLAGRAILDAHALRFHQPEKPHLPAVLRPSARRKSRTPTVRVVRAALPEAVQANRRAFPAQGTPLPSFLAPILDRSATQPPFHLDQARLTPAEQKAARQIVDGLRADGLLVTLAHVLQTLGPHRFTSGNHRQTTELARLGLPVDLLHWFAPGASNAGRPTSLVAQLSQRLAAGHSPDELSSWLRSLRFAFRPTHPGFQAADESGTQTIGHLRLQAGGGYRGGLVEGGSFHVIDQLALALPDAQLLVSVPEEYITITRWLAESRWPRPSRVTLVAEPGEIAPWAQDNGKAGMILDSRGEPARLAVLAPRYATISEGVQAAGHQVLHSPLLFQGGNLLVVQQPSDDRRVLLVGEAEIQRNRRLGLSRDQVLEAFRVELGVDSTLAVPSASYHLDYDLAIRRQDDGVLAFVNDSTAASRLILSRGLLALEQAGLISLDAARQARTLLDNAEGRQLRRFLTTQLEPFITREGRLREDLVTVFASRPEDAAAANLALFLNAIDLLASEDLAGPEVSDPALDHDYLQALHELQTANREQRKLLGNLGWHLVPVPSLPDLKQSLNYLNGVHDRTRCLLPVNGGFYSDLDEAAMQVFRAALGPDVEIVPILTQDLQQRHGALHCAVSASPRLPPEGG